MLFSCLLRGISSAKNSKLALGFLLASIKTIPFLISVFSSHLVASSPNFTSTEQDCPQLALETGSL